MSAMTNHLEPKARALMYGGTPWAGKPTTLYFGLLTAAANEDGTFTEYSGNGYARHAIACTSTNWEVNGDTVSNKIAQRFSAAATADWTGITHWGLFESSSKSAKLLIYGTLTEAKTYPKNSNFNIPIGELSLTLAGATGTYMAHKVLSHIFLSQTWTAIPTYYVGLGTNADADQIYGEPMPAGSGSTAPSATGYSRGSLPNTTANWPQSTGATNTTSNATGIANFPDATASWNQLTNFALLDAQIVTSGVTYDSSTTSVSSSVTYAQSGYTITVSKTSHGLNTGDAVNLTFSAGTGGTGASGWYVVTKIDADTFTVTSLVSATINAGASCSWVPAYIVITKTGHGLTTTNPQTGAAQHVDIWFQTTDATFFTSRRFYVSSVPTSSTFRVNLNSDETQYANASKSAYYSTANVISYGSMTSAITVSEGDTPNVPIGAINANTD